MQTEQTIDYLVIINGLFITNESKRELVEVNLCSYDINKKQVSSESSYYIKAIASLPLSSLSSSSLSIQSDPDLLAKAEDLPSIALKIKKFFEDNYLANDSTFGIIYKDELLMSFFADLVPYQSDRSFNLFNEFKSFYLENATSLDDMLLKLKLKQTEPNTHSLKELNTMVRVVNKMIKDGKHFIFVIPSSIEPLSQSQPLLQSQSNQPLMVINDSSMLNTNIPIHPIPNYIKAFYLRFKGLPITITKQEMINLLYLHDITPNHIAISYDIFGRITGDAIIRTYHESNHREILSNYKYYYYRDSIVDVIETNEADFNSCLKSEVFYFNKPNDSYAIGNIFLKMSKIPYSAREEDIKNFLRNYTIAEYGIKLNRYRKGNSTGEAVIAFINEKECSDVLQRENGRILMNQIITLEKSSIDQFEEYASSSSFSNWIKILSEHIQADDVQRSLFISNLPLDITKEDFIQFIQLFNINESNLIADERLLSENGSLIVKFFSEEEAEQAKEYLTKESLKWKGRNKMLNVENLLFVVNKGNES